MNSDNAEESDMHPWYGFLWSFSFIIVSSSIIFFSMIYSFAGALKRAPLFEEYYFYVLCFSVILVILNLLITDDTPFKKNIRYFWGCLLFLTLFMMLLGCIILKLIYMKVGNLAISLGVFVVKKLICYKEKPHQIKS
jgi:hypothetical protein